MQPRRTKSHLLLSARVFRGDFDLALGLLYQWGLTSSEKVRERGHLVLRAALPPGQKAKDLLVRMKACGRSLGRPIFHGAKVQKVSRGDWSRKYQRFLEPFSLIPPVAGFAGLRVDPRGRLPRELRDDTLYIEAGLAFGTGTHATTRLAAELLAEALVERPRSSVLDVGCGTGILAMIAKKLGAGRVVAVDNDPEARITARANFRRNLIFGVVLKPELRGLREKFPVIVSNIGLQALLELKSALLRLASARGDLILTGLLYRDVPELLEAYRGLRLLTRRNRRGWTALRLRKH